MGARVRSLFHHQRDATGAWNMYAWGIPQSPGETLPQGKNPITTQWEYVSSNNTNAPGVVFGVNFSSGLEADEVPSGFALNTATSDPNDYTYNAGTMVSSESKEFDWVMNAKDLGLQQVEISVTSTSPKVLSETQIHPFTVAEAPPLPEADLAINASLPPVEGFNQDIDPGKPGLQLYPGDKVYYRLTVTNHGPDSVSWLVNSAIWPEASLAGVDQWGGAPSERTMTMFVDEPDGNTRYNSDLYDPDGDIALASGETATMFWQTAVQDWAGEGPVTVQFKTGDGGNGYIVDPSMGNNDSTAEFEVVYPTQAA